MARTSTPTLSGHSDEWVLDDAEARDKRKQKRAQKGNMKRRRVDEKLFDDAEAEDKRRRKRVRNEKAERKRVDEESFDDLPLGDDDAKSDEGPSRASSLPMVKPPNPCYHCVQSKNLCLLLRTGRSSACTECQRKKRQCDVGNVVKKMIASGQLGNLSEADAKISSLSDVQASSLDSLLRKFGKSLESMEQRLLAMETKVNVGGEGERADRGASERSGYDSDPDYVDKPEGDYTESPVDEGY